MRRIIAYFVVALMVIVGCQDNDDVETVENVDSMEELTASENFTFDPSKEVSVTITLLDNTDQPVNNARVELLSGDVNDSTAKRITSGITNSSGVFTTTFKLRSYRDSIFVDTRYVGIPTDLSFYLNQNTIDVQLGGAPAKIGPYTFNKGVVANPGFAFIGDFTTGSTGGVPLYLESENDDIDSEFLADINNALPERDPVPDAHPEYLASSNQTNTVLLEEADVWITFVHEGAGYRSALCYYAYDQNTPPSSVDMIENLNVIYPNVSYTGSGGGLQSGNKVHIGTFSAGTEIAWAIVANGWNRNNGIYTNKPIYYSDYEFNPESSTELSQHNVLLHDNIRDLFLIGFEDLNREGSSDDDFNDAIFYVTTNPIDAAESSDTPQLYPDPEDSDNDGVVDSADDYPDDPDKAFDNFYPGEDDFGSLAFEDLWPEKGDYDFNDLVVDYNMNQIANGDNKVTSIIASLKVKAVGAGYKNGFGIQLPMNSSLVESVEGVNVPGNIVSLASNGTESGQSQATIIFFENVYDLFPTISHGYINTQEGSDFVEYQNMEVQINFTQPLSIDDVGIPPYNPFIIINQERGKEVHLPNYEPTDLADQSYFGTQEDDSDPSQGRYYRDNDNLPWAMHIPTSFDYPKENTSIIQGHLVFDNWVLSDGYSYMDWYLDRSQYRNDDYLY